MQPSTLLSQERMKNEVRSVRKLFDAESLYLGQEESCCVVSREGAEHLTPDFYSYQRQNR